MKKSSKTVSTAKRENSIAGDLPSQLELETALQNLYDFMERTMAPYFLLGENAFNVYHDLALKGKDIACGIEKKCVTKEVMSLFKTYFPKTEITDRGFKYEVGRVPVFIKFIQRRYEFFQRPDVRWYKADIYKLPNPFDRYWAARFIVR